MSAIQEHTHMSWFSTRYGTFWHVQQCNTTVSFLVSVVGKPSICIPQVIYGVTSPQVVPRAGKRGRIVGHEGSHRQQRKNKIKKINNDNISFTTGEPIAQIARSIIAKCVCTCMRKSVEYRLHLTAPVPWPLLIGRQERSRRLWWMHRAGKIY